MMFLLSRQYDSGRRDMRILLPFYGISNLKHDPIQVFPDSAQNFFMSDSNNITLVMPKVLRRLSTCHL